MDGKWKQLTNFLKNSCCEELRIHDDELVKIVNSDDKKRPLPIGGNGECSIVQRAKDAGYNVCYSSNPMIKIFVKNGKV